MFINVIVWFFSAAGIIKAEDAGDRRIMDTRQDEQVCTILLIIIILLFVYN
jgi:hypothetical protein